MPSLCCAALLCVLGRWRTDNSNQCFPPWRSSEFDPIGHRSHLASTPDLHTSFVNRIAHTYIEEAPKKKAVVVWIVGHKPYFHWTRRIMVPGRTSKEKTKKRQRQKKKNLACSDVSAQTRRPSISFPVCLRAEPLFFCKFSGSDGLNVTAAAGSHRMRTRLVSCGIIAALIVNRVTLA
jgi:hypothetical protein